MEQRLFIAGLLVLGQLLLPAAAEDVAYRWIDADGVTHFSDTPPAAGSPASGAVDSIDLPGDFAPPADPAADYYSITNQWQRLREERAERDRLALEQQRLRLERDRTQQSARKTAAAGADSAGAPVVLYGEAARYPRPGHGRRIFPARQPLLFPGLPRHDFRPGGRGHHAPRLPVQHGFGNGAPAAPAHFSCCR